MLTFSHRYATMEKQTRPESERWGRNNHTLVSQKNEATLNKARANKARANKAMANKATVNKAIASDMIP
jgi:hypothetical protein